MKKLNNKGFIDGLSMFYGVILIILTIFLLNFLTGGTFLNYRFTQESDEIDYQDVMNFIEKQHNEVEEANETISELEQEIIDLKTTNWFTKYNAINQELEKVEIKYLIMFIVISSVSILFAFISVKLYKKQYNKKLSDLQDKVKQLTEKEEKSKIDDGKIYYFRPNGGRFYHNEGCEVMNDYITEYKPITKQEIDNDALLKPCPVCLAGGVLKRKNV